MIFYIEHDSPLGHLLIGASSTGICGIYFEEHKHFRGKDGWQHAPDHPHLRAGVKQLDEYFSRQRQRFTLPLDLAGTPFQRAVWQQLEAIPFGESITYSQQAQRLGNPGASRAVGSANGRNPVSIVVPCHRVIGASGAVTGYAGGLERKRYLLALEGIVLR
ncbi:MAG: methylated-DNA--[protein]-cysteine S-methyltransferase [Herminiimonas sp.]|nr:methylated-DNA--[protein]-cysteine S-methyltransferase [Herminiimonas sp.]